MQWSMKMSYKFAALFAGAALAISTQADASSCTQADLTGNWRIEINTGTPNSNGIALDILSCLVRFQADGTLVPLACQAVNSRQGNSGTFAAFTTDRKFRVTPGCAVSISGTPESSEDFEIQFFDGNGGKEGYGVNDANMTMSPTKQMMLGWMSFGGFQTIPVTPRATVVAIRR